MAAAAAAAAAGVVVGSGIKVAQAIRAGNARSNNHKLNAFNIARQQGLLIAHGLELGYKATLDAAVMADRTAEAVSHVVGEVAASGREIKGTALDSVLRAELVGSLDEEFLRINAQNEIREVNRTVDELEANRKLELTAANEAQVDKILSAVGAVLGGAAGLSGGVGFGGGGGDSSPAPGLDLTPFRSSGLFEPLRLTNSAGSGVLRRDRKVGSGTVLRGD